MSKAGLASMLLRKQAIACQFRSGGEIVAVKGNFASDAFVVGHNIFDLCSFLIGSVEYLSDKEELSLPGTHLTISDRQYIVDSVTTRVDAAQYYLLIEDQTDRYRLVNQLGQQRNEADILKHQLERQNEQLMLLKDAAESAFQTRTEFLAKMSHEIRTPLNALIGFTELLQQDDLPKEQAKHAENIQVAGQALSEMLNDILDLSRIESGKYQIELVPFSLVPMLEDVVALCIQKADQKNLELHLNVDPALPELLRGDKVRLAQVILNLLTNAIKFTENGSVVLSVSEADASDSDVLVEFKVTDTGRGIPEEQQQEIFERFSQTRVADATVQGGIGLGLAIVRQLVDAMGGRIAVESVLGEGATFRVRIGMQRIDQTSIDVVDSGENAGSINNIAGLNILLAEDSQLNRQFVREVLQGLGASVIAVDNGKSAVQKLLTEPVDVVLMDVMMPELTGDQAIARIRHEFLFPLNKTPIITLSGKNSDADKEKFLTAGADFVLPKPYRGHQLVQAIETVLFDARINTPAPVDALVGDDITEEMVSIFKNDVPGYLLLLINALYQHREQQFIFQAHKLQSAMWVMEIMDAYEILARLENEVLSFDERYSLTSQVCEIIASALGEGAASTT